MTSTFNRPLSVHSGESDHRFVWTNPISDSGPKPITFRR